MVDRLILEGKFVPEGGTESPYSHTLYVETSGRGDYDNVQDAYDAAILGGATYASRWRIFVSDEVFNATVTALSPGVDFYGCGPDATFITQKVTSSTGNNWFNMKIRQSTASESLEMVVTSGVTYTILCNMDVRCDRQWAGTSTALLVTGPGSTTSVASVIYADGCNFYANNPYNDVLACANSVHIASTVKDTYVEFRGGVYLKTSTGATSPGTDLGIWTEGRGVSYVDLGSGTSYRHGHAKAGKPVEIRRNSNPDFTGTIGAYLFYAKDGIGYVDNDAHADVFNNEYVLLTRLIRVGHDMVINRNLYVGGSSSLSGTLFPRHPVPASNDPTASVAGYTGVTVAAAATTALISGQFAGLLILSSSSSAGTITLVVDTTNSTGVGTLNVAGPGSLWSLVSGTASKINIYVSGGAGGTLTLQNNTAASITVKYMMLRTK